MSSPSISFLSLSVAFSGSTTCGLTWTQRTTLKIEKRMLATWTSRWTAIGSRRVTIRKRKERDATVSIWANESCRYLAKSQIFNPASVHCYIQALLKGCRCIESNESTRDSSFLSTASLHLPMKLMCSTARHRNQKSLIRIRKFAPYSYVTCSKQSMITHSLPASRDSLKRTDWFYLFVYDPQISSDHLRREPLLSRETRCHGTHVHRDPRWYVDVTTKAKRFYQRSLSSVEQNVSFGHPCRSTRALFRLLINWEERSLLR